jgi:hypothetical protein
VRDQVKLLFFAALLCCVWASAGPSAASAACANEALRVGPSAGLPECRAYEQVSPVAKGGGGVDQAASVASSPSGEAVTFISSSAFASAQANVKANTYLANRNASGWGVLGIDAPQLNPHGFIVLPTLASSPDLTKSLQASKLALAPGAIEGGSNLYLRDNRTGVRTLIAAVPGNAFFEAMTTGAAMPFVGASDDWSHLVFQSPVALTSDAVEGLSNVYEYTGGELRLVSLLPDGSAALNAHAGSGRLGNQHIVSADGSRIFFSVGEGEGPLYLREGGTTTVPISASQRAVDAGTMAPAQFAGAAPDGSFLYFTSNGSLTEASNANVARSLYRYDVESGQLTDLTPGENFVGDEPLAISEDASYIYFTGGPALAEGSGPGTNIYVWHAGQIRFIGHVAPDQTAEAFGPFHRLASPSGRFLAFAGFTAYTSDDLPSPNCPTDPGQGNAPESCRDVYLYDYVEDSLACVSCAGVGAGFSDLGGQLFRGATSGDRFPRSVLDDGTVYFDTPNRLLPRDVNGVGDAYSWRAGELQLLSTGTAEEASNFAEATADGGSVFIRTQQQLVGQDSDRSVDLYAARVGGGFAGQNPPAPSPGCAGESCRAAVPALTPPAAPQSASLRASGNNVRKNARKRCTQQQRKKARKARAKKRGRQIEKRPAGKTRKCGGQNR